MRLLLATAVFIGHEGPVAGLKLVPADLAVQAFFVISGFYMALILDSKYRGATKVFLINRFTKIYSMYFAVLIGCLVAMIYFGTTFYMSSRQFMKFLGDARFTTALSYVAANLGIFGLDALMFFNLKSDGQLCSILTCQGYGAHLFMLIPQAWSLSLELLFYLMAPFILRKSSSLLIAIVSAILVLRLVLWLNFPFIGGDPWSYRFFPFELATFLLGSLAYRFYRHEYFHRIQKFSFVAVFVVLFASFGYNELFGGYGKPLYVFIFWLCTPFLFSTSKSWK